MARTRKLKAFVLMALILMIAGSLVSGLLFSSDITGSKFASFREVLQMGFYGVVHNTTSHTIRVTDYKYVRVIPPGMTSRQIGILDADSLILDRPTEIDGQRYEAGVFKFCDFGYLTISEVEGMDLVLPNKRAHVCRLLNDFNLYNSVQEAFDRARM